MNMRIDRERRVPESLAHHHGRGFVPHTGQLFQQLEGLGNRPSVFVDQDLRELPNRFRFLRTQSARLDDRSDLLDRSSTHIPRVIS